MASAHDRHPGRTLTGCRARALSVASLPLVLYGCVATPVMVDTDAPRSHIVVTPGRAGYVIAAPHGSSDPRTGEIAAEIARRTGFGLVVATGFAIEPENRNGSGRRYQGNRPYEGVPGRPPVEETPSDAAREVYLAYEKRVQDAAQGALRFYVEIHANGRRESAGRIEVATVGVDIEMAQRLRTLLELIRDAHLRAYPGTPSLEILVEPADPNFYAARGSERDGILRLPARALHLELPRLALGEGREPYTTILTQFIAEAATLPSRR